MDDAVLFRPPAGGGGFGHDLWGDFCVCPFSDCVFKPEENLVVSHLPFIWDVVFFLLSGLCIFVYQPVHYLLSFGFFPGAGQKNECVF